MKTVLILIILVMVAGCNVIYEKGTPVREITNPEENVTMLNDTAIEDEGTTIFESASLGLHPGNLTIYFLDVKGSMAAIVTPSQQLIIVDTGHRTSAQGNIADIRDIGFLRADALILSSIRSYRIGGIPVFMERLKPEESFYSGIGNEGYEEYRLIKDYLSNFTRISQDKLVIFGGVDVRFLVPYDDGSGFRLDDTQNSIMIKIIYNDFTVLFGSDCYSECEDRISFDSDLTADVFSIPLMGRCEDELGVSTYFLKTASSELVVGNNVCDSVKLKIGALDQLLHDEVDGKLVVTSDGNGFTYYIVR